MPASCHVFHGCTAWRQNCNLCWLPSLKALEFRVDVCLWCLLYLIIVSFLRNSVKYHWTGLKLTFWLSNPPSVKMLRPCVRDTYSRRPTTILDTMQSGPSTWRFKIGGCPTQHISIMFTWELILQNKQKWLAASANKYFGYRKQHYQGKAAKNKPLLDCSCSHESH